MSRVGSRALSVYISVEGWSTIDLGTHADSKKIQD